jgi:hypothetical protein
MVANCVYACAVVLVGGSYPESGIWVETAGFPEYDDGRVTNWAVITATGGLSGGDE